MKRIIQSFSVAVLIAVFACGAAFGYSDRYRAISSVRITLKTSDLSAGDELSDNAEDYVSVPDNNYYTLSDAEWIDDVDYLKVGAEPRMRVYLASSDYTKSSTNYDTIYNFRGSYTSSNVKVTNGEFVSATKQDSNETLAVTVRVKAIKGTYEEPEDVYWGSSRGVAKWSNADGGSGYFDVACYRNSSVIKRLTSYHGTSYNFYPYMTKEGNYTFRVRSVAPSDVSSSTGKSSDWIESDTLYIDSDEVSDGSGQTSGDTTDSSQTVDSINYPNGTGTADVTGWVKSGDAWYFRYPNGETVKDGWLKLNDKYYLFNAQGQMLTGWQQNKYGIWFYMDKTSGAMQTGWLHDGDYWYYLNTTKDDMEGCMVRGWWTIGDRKYYFNESGVMVTGWFQIDGNWYYFYPEGSTGGAYGYMATSTTIGSFYVDANGIWQH